MKVVPQMDDISAQRVANNVQVLMSEWDVQDSEKCALFLDADHVLQVMSREKADNRYQHLLRQNCNVKITEILDKGMVLQTVFVEIKALILSLKDKLQQSNTTLVETELQISACSGLLRLLSALKQKLIEMKNALYGEVETIYFAALSVVLKGFDFDLEMLLKEVLSLKLDKCCEKINLYETICANGEIFRGICFKNQKHRVGQAVLNGENVDVFAKFDFLESGGEGFLNGRINFSLSGGASSYMSMRRVWSDISNKKRGSAFYDDPDKVIHMVKTNDLSCSWQETPGLVFQIYRVEEYSSKMVCLLRHIAVEIYQKGKFAFLAYEVDKGLSVLECAMGYHAQDDRRPMWDESAQWLEAYPSSAFPFEEQINNIMHPRCGQNRYFYLQDLGRYFNLEEKPILKEDFAWPEFFGLPNPKVMIFRDIQKREITGRADWGGVVYRKAHLPFYRIHSIEALAQMGQVLPEMEKMVDNVDVETRAKLQGDDPQKVWLPSLRR